MNPNESTFVCEFWTAWWPCHLHRWNRNKSNLREICCSFPPIWYPFVFRLSRPYSPPSRMTLKTVTCYQYGGDASQGYLPYWIWWVHVTYWAAVEEFLTCSQQLLSAAFPRISRRVLSTSHRCTTQLWSTHTCFHTLVLCKPVEKIRINWT